MCTKCTVLNRKTTMIPHQRLREVEEGKDKIVLQPWQQANKRDQLRLY